MPKEAVSFVSEVNQSNPWIGSVGLQSVSIEEGGPQKFEGYVLIWTIFI